MSVVVGLNMLSLSVLALNNSIVQELILALATNVRETKNIEFAVTDVTKLYPVLNSTSYIVAKEDTNVEIKQENVNKEETNNVEFDGSAVDVFSFNKNETSNLKISYTSNYQKAMLYGITITNYADKTDIDYEKIMNKELNLSRKVDKILLYSTHTSETFVNSEGYKFGYTGTMRCKDPKYNMLSVANVLSQTLTSKNFNVIFDTTPHDYTSYDNAYTNSAQTIKNQLNKNGKFGLTIDLHRDAYGDLYDGPTVNINGKEVAQIMIVVGIGTEGYENLYWETNLAIAMKIMKIGEEMYPGLFRPILIRESRYNQHYNEGSILTEIGNTGNTHEEVFYAVSCLGNILDKVFK